MNHYQIMQQKTWAHMFYYHQKFTPSDVQKPLEFFKTRKITSVPEKTKKRKFVTPFLAGNLSKKSNMKILETANS